ncbi:MAG TPA: sigma-54 dependent transcriptional regulator [Polyangiaceae bacterium]
MTERHLSAAPRALDTASQPVRVLVVDDEPALRKSIARILTARGYEVTTADDGLAGLEALERGLPDVLLTDLLMPRMTGLDLLQKAKQRWPALEVVIMTAFADVDTAVSAVKAGAYDFLTKPFPSNDAVALSVAKAAEHHRLIARAHELEEKLIARERFGELIGNSRRMQEVYRLIEGVASATSTVLVLGESGTGKELVARAIHQSSPRQGKAFVTVNCAAIPKDLVESELFGHVRGAFTGAQSARAGLFDTANNGTIFLDEVGDLPLAAQVKLLRALQEGEIKRVGADETHIVDVRVVAATNVDLKAKIESGEFRRDLYYRLNVIAMHLPALREREEDVVLLAAHFVRKLAARMGRSPKTLGESALAALRAYSWPGNVRELEHAIEHAFVLSRGDVIEAADLPIEREREPAAFSSESPTAISPPWNHEAYALPYPEAKKRVLGDFDLAYVREQLRRASGNVSEAARRSGLDRSNFRRILRRLRGEEPSE